MANWPYRRGGGCLYRWILGKGKGVLKGGDIGKGERERGGIGKGARKKGTEKRMFAGGLGGCRKEHGHRDR
jgi:hypothetical protein